MCRKTSSLNTSCPGTVRTHTTAHHPPVCLCKLPLIAEDMFRRFVPLRSFVFPNALSSRDHGPFSLMRTGSATTPWLGVRTQTPLGSRRSSTTPSDDTVADKKKSLTSETPSNKASTNESESEKKSVRNPFYELAKEASGYNSFASAPLETESGREVVNVWTKKYKQERVGTFISYISCLYSHVLQIGQYRGVNVC